MTLVFNEREDSRRRETDVNGDTEKLHFFGLGPVDDQVTARAEFIAFLPLTWDDLSLTAIDVIPIGSSGNWDLWATYTFSAELLDSEYDVPDPEPTDPLGPENGFDLVAHTVHITQSLETERSVSAASPNALNKAWQEDTAYPLAEQVIANGNVYVCATAGTSASSGSGPTGTGTGIVDGTAEWDYLAADVPIDPLAPNYGGAIGVSQNAIAGTDAYAGHLELTLMVQVYPVTLDLINTLRSMVGTINDAEFRGSDEGEALYLGATGIPKPGSIWTMVHRWAISENLENVQVSPDIIIPFKSGWSWLWVSYKPGVVGDYLLPVPKAAYVERIYRKADHSTLPT